MTPYETELRKMAQKYISAQHHYHSLMALSVDAQMRGEQEEALDYQLRAHRGMHEDMFDLQQRLAWGYEAVDYKQATNSYAAQRRIKRVGVEGDVD